MSDPLAPPPPPPLSLVPSFYEDGLRLSPLPPPPPPRSLALSFSVSPFCHFHISSSSLPCPPACAPPRSLRRKNLDFTSSSSSLSVVHVRPWPFPPLSLTFPFRLGVLFLKKYLVQINLPAAAASPLLSSPSHSRSFPYPFISRDHRMALPCRPCCHRTSGTAYFSQF